MVPKKMIQIFKSSDMDMEFNTGQMVLITRASGISTKLKVKGPSGMPKATSTEVNSKMIWLMGMVNIPTSMAQNIKESLRTMYKRDMEKKNGLTVPNTSDPT